jgi:hypothetical protein
MTRGTAVTKTHATVANSRQENIVGKSAPRTAAAPTPASMISRGREARVELMRFVIRVKLLLQASRWLQLCNYETGLVILAHAPECHVPVTGVGGLAQQGQFLGRLTRQRNSCSCTLNELHLEAPNKRVITTNLGTHMGTQRVQTSCKVAPQSTVLVTRD